MTAETHDAQLLGAYVLETLDPDERRDVDAHLADCEVCRADLVELEAVKNVLEDIPPEALLHGPPDADLVLQRTLRQVREEVAQETAGATRRRWMPAVAAAAVLVAGALGAGAALGRGTAPEQVAEPPPATVVPTTASPLPPNTLVGSIETPDGVRMTARLVPAAGWVRVNATVAGIPAGQDCRIIVVGSNGEREIAGGWIVSAAGEQNGTNLDGSASVAIDKVVALEIQNTAGQTFVTLEI